MTQPGTSASRSVRAAIKQLPVGAGAALFGLLLLVKVYAVANFSLTTATTLVVASPSAVLLGTVASYTYLIVAAVAFLCLFVWFKAGPLTLGNLTSILLVSGFVLLSLLSPFVYWWKCGLLFLGLILALYLRDPPSVTPEARAVLVQMAGVCRSARFRRVPRFIAGVGRFATTRSAGAGRLPRASRTLGRRLRTVSSTIRRSTRWWWGKLRSPLGQLTVDSLLVAGAVAIIIMSVLPTLGVPWRSAEVVTFSQPVVTAQRTSPSDAAPQLQTIVTGYVMSTDDTWWEILDDDHRYLIKVPAHLITSRYVCRADPKVLLGHNPILKGFATYSSPNTSCSAVIERLKNGQLPAGYGG